MFNLNMISNEECNRIKTTDDSSADSIVRTFL